MSQDKRIEEILVRKGTEGIAIGSDPNTLEISFEQGNSLTFASSPEHREIWGGGSMRSVSMSGKVVQASSAMKGRPIGRSQEATTCTFSLARSLSATSRKSHAHYPGAHLTSEHLETMDSHEWGDFKAQGIEVRLPHSGYIFR